LGSGNCVFDKFQKLTTAEKRQWEQQLVCKGKGQRKERKRCRGEGVRKAGRKELTKEAHYHLTTNESVTVQALLSV
jgi:hypothetical protein